MMAAMLLENTMKTRKSRLILACALALAGAAALPAAAQQLNISTDPLGTGVSSIKPNVMFILDDSGSMNSDYMPDYVNDSHNPPNTTAGCFDHGDDGDSGGGSNIGGNPNACIFGDPPFNSSDFNSIYYNPDLRYRPALNDDGTEMPLQDSATTSNWTAVRTNPYQNTTTTNIVTGYQDRVWCANQADAATSGTCRQNSGYNFPNAAFPYGEDSGGSTKYIAVSPYSYRMQTRQFCSDAARTICVSGSAINPAVHVYPAPEFCKDAELTDCVAGAAVTAAYTFSGVRWCNNANHQEDSILTVPRVNYCQRKKIGAFIHAKHIGLTVNGTVPARQSEGNIQVQSINAAGGNVTGITIGATQVLSGPIAVPGGTPVTTLAGQIVTAINAGPASGTYVATQSGANVIVTSIATGTTENGKAITVNATTVGTTSATGTIQIGTAGSANTITSVTINGQQLLSCSPGSTQNFTVTGGHRVVGGGRRHERGAQPDHCAERIVQQQPPAGHARCVAHGHQHVRADAAGRHRSMDRDQQRHLRDQHRRAGQSRQHPEQLGGRGDQGGCHHPHHLQHGQPPAVAAWRAYRPTMVTTATAPMSGGAVAFTGRVRIGVGQFTRTDIVPAVNSYAKGIGRTDCAGVTCTYEEEMTNFANWYAYHRTRMHMMKAAAGRAFANLNEGFRVGFITICPVSGNDCQTSAMGANVVASKYLKIADYDTAHRVNWYAKLYSQTPSNYTPLREALSRVGLIYAGKFGSGLTGGLSAAADDPVTASCQPNFAILSTDGYWNGNVGPADGQFDLRSATRTTRIPRPTRGRRTACSTAARRSRRIPWRTWRCTTTRRTCGRR